MSEARPRRIRVREGDGGMTLTIRTKPFWVTAGPAAFLLAGLVGGAAVALNQGWVAEPPTSRPEVLPWAGMVVLPAAVAAILCLLAKRSGSIRRR